jgi:Ca2+-dependent lipid-binding protein
MLVYCIVQLSTSASICAYHCKTLYISQLGITSDPFAVFSVGASAARSAVVENKTNPQWKEQYFVLFVKDLLADSLKVGAKLLN